METLIKIAKWKSFNNPLEKVLGCESICPTLFARGQDNNAQMILLSEELDNTTDLKDVILEYDK